MNAIRKTVTERIHGANTQRTYILREAKRKPSRCRGCQGTIRIGQAYYDYDERRFHFDCFEQRFK